MFTLITLVLLALLAGITLKVKRILSKKKETIKHTRKPTRKPRELNEWGEGYKLKQNKPLEDSEEPSITIRKIRKKKISKSKYKKRLTNHVVRFM